MNSGAAVKSATRVFEILELFRETKRPLRLKEVVDQFGYPPSSVAGLLKTMTAQGYLSFDSAARTYFPTARLVQLVNWVPGIEFEGTVVRQAMENLLESTGECIVLGTINDVFVEFVEALRSTQPIQLWTPPGTRLILVNLGMGWLFLKHMLAPEQRAADNPRIAQIYRRTVEFGHFKEKDFPLKALHERLDAIGEQDYLFTSASSYQENMKPGHPGGGMVSMLVPPLPGHRPLAFGVGGPAERLTANLNSIVSALRRETKKLAKFVAQS